MNTAIQFLHKTPWLMIMYYQTKFGSKKDQQFRRYSSYCPILVIWTLAVTLTSEIANQSLCMHSAHDGASQYQIWWQYVWPGEDIIWTNTDILALHCDLDFEYSNPFFFYKTLWLMMMYHQIKFGCHGINSSEERVERVMFWSYEPFQWPWPWKSKQFFPAWHSGS